MTVQLTTFMWNSTSFSGTGQLNMGPEFLGFVNKLFRVQVRGHVGYATSSLSIGVSITNYLVFGIQHRPHGASPEDLTLTADSDDWLVRAQTGHSDYGATWPAPGTAPGFAGVDGLDFEWHGQLLVGGNTDIFASFKDNSGGSVPTFQTRGTCRVWWG